MKLVGRHREALWIDLTPLVDVVFILLVFVLLAATFSRQQAVEVSLPKADSGRPAAHKVLIVSVEAGGQVWVGADKVSPEALRARLDQLRPQYDGLVVRADGRVALDRAVLVIDRARSAGFESMSIATRPPQSR